MSDWGFLFVGLGWICFILWSISPYSPFTPKALREDWGQLKREREQERRYAQEAEWQDYRNSPLPIEPDEWTEQARVLLIRWYRRESKANADAYLDAAMKLLAQKVGDPRP